MNPGDINTKLRRMIDTAFNTPIKPPVNSRFYKLGVFLTIITTILLPTVYFLIIVLVGYGMYRYNHLLHDFIQSSSRVDLNQEIWILHPIAWFLYIPLIIGGVIEFFLLKGFWPKKKKKDIPLYVVNQQNEPLLYFFIERICRHINTPVPKRIELMMEPKVSYMFRGGIFPFRRGDLTLLIGLPILSGLTVRQFAGVLAHELGYLRRKGDLCLVYVNSLIQGWIYRCVHDEGTDEEPDWVDSNVDASYYGRYGRVSFKWLWLMLVFLAQFFILLIRGILSLFLLLASAVNSFYSCQMKYDSDQFQIQVAGSRDFEATLYAMAIMERVFEKTSLMTELSWRKHVLVDNLPALIREEAENMVPSFYEKKNMIDSLLDQEPKPFDMEPTLRERVARARQTIQPGTCKVDFKSRMLMNDFDSLSKQLTKTFYKTNLGTDLYEKKRYLSVAEYQDYILENKPIIRTGR